MEAVLGVRRYDWSLVVKMTNTLATTMRNDFYGQANEPNLGVSDAEPTVRDLILDFAEGAVSGDRKAQILISDNSIDGISKPIDLGQELVEVTITGHGRKGTTDTVNKTIKYWTIT